MYAPGPVLHVEPHIAFAIDASALLPPPPPPAGSAPEAPAGQPGAEMAPLGSLVSFDLDSNLQYRLRATRVLSQRA